MSIKIMSPFVGKELQGVLYLNLYHKLVHHRQMYTCMWNCANVDCWNQLVLLIKEGCAQFHRAVYRQASLSVITFSRFKNANCVVISLICLQESSCYIVRLWFGYGVYPLRSFGKKYWSFRILMQRIEWLKVLFPYDRWF